VGLFILGFILGMLVTGGTISLFVNIFAVNHQTVPRMVTRREAQLLVMCKNIPVEALFECVDPATAGYFYADDVLNFIHNYHFN